MGEMYRQLASAQLRGRLYKTGYRRTKAAPKVVQMGVTGQSTAIAAGHAQVENSNWTFTSKCWLTL